MNIRSFVYVVHKRFFYNYLFYLSILYSLIYYPNNTLFLHCSPFLPHYSHRRIHQPPFHY
ncbi:hypothetical protein HanRHA438_Chr05g0203311 [Helianthus annuus]|nr:hypothetical protein HanRHA438_Chr05g0203311 [Helianthus annuus]